MRLRMEESKKPRSAKMTRKIERSKASRETGAGWVYAIRIKDGPVKIGMTFGEDPFARIQWVSQGSPYPIEIIGMIFDLDALGVEARLHLLFKEKRGKGEWFNLEQPDIESLFKDHNFATVAQVEKIQQEMLNFVCRRAEEYGKKLRGEPHSFDTGEVSE